MFKNNDKVTKKQANLLEKYGLENINRKDAESIQKILSDLAGNGLLKVGTLLSGKTEDKAKITYLSALVEQNWIIIRQLDRLNNILSKGENN